MRVSIDLLNLRGDGIRGARACAYGISDVLIGDRDGLIIGLERTGLIAARTGAIDP
jgi:hypothetical protein